MPSLLIEIPIQPRLLTKAEAARYCRISVPKFTALCPVVPIEIEANKRVYDIKELDNWIDLLKRHQAYTDEEILSKL